MYAVLLQEIVHHDSRQPACTFFANLLKNMTDWKRTVANIPSSLLEEISSKCKAASIACSNRVGNVLDVYDSRSPEWHILLETLSKNECGQHPVVIVLLAPSGRGPRQDLQGDIIRELDRYIKSIPLKRLPFTDRKLSSAVGCFARSAHAIKAITEALEKPDTNACPIVSRLGAGQCCATLVLLFANTNFRVNVHIS